MKVSEAMENLAGRLRPHLSRPVVTDPTRTAATPCVLVELPQLEPNGTLCGERLWRHVLLVIGIPGARAEMDPLAELLDDVLVALDDIGIGWTLAEPVAYTPLVQDGTADPSLAYRLTLEEIS